ncbi:hypothetical protein EVAR_95941_1 [Eumeta japonica]|uniref:Uncharacterized protein n=1 Tax=Eumeta variegata TaxID=151549 RepID=A0A4C1V974_EUMVA|nr:hypothetical protein EVAR_95941_1 [Eumeta japonica]
MTVIGPPAPAGRVRSAKLLSVGVPVRDPHWAPDVTGSVSASVLASRRVVATSGSVCALWTVSAAVKTPWDSGGSSGERGPPDGGGARQIAAPVCVGPSRILRSDAVRRKISDIIIFRSTQNELDENAYRL